jgi:site-specific recombinase XerD
VTLLRPKNANPKVVEEVLGHATITIPLDIYSHVLPDIQERAVDRLGILLS